MINLIIWSKDRAAQLHLLLESLDRNLPDSFITSVIYTYSSPEFKAGYDRIQDEFDANRVGLVLETDLREQTLSLIDDKSFDLVAFSTDDTVIYKKHDPLPYRS